MGTDDFSLRDVVMTNLINRSIRIIVGHTYLNKENVELRELMPHLVTVHHQQKSIKLARLQIRRQMWQYEREQFVQR